ncbi:hypothetical protein AA11825_2477 [Acetobacter pomorum DSM 11825]|nr:hypothetical protein AA11825_2477 [Acetobacter pomorum DSM 11825]
MADPICTEDKLFRKRKAFLSKQYLPAIDPAVSSMDTGIIISVLEAIILSPSLLYLKG